MVPIGGGGLIAGVATWIKENRPDVKIIGVEEATCNAMSQSRARSKVIELPPAPIIADGIGVRRVSANNLDTVTRLVDDIVSVTSDEIANAILLMLEVEMLVTEGAAAVTLAALLNERVPGLRGKNVVAIISGGNIDVNLLSRIINRGLAFDGRVTKLDTVIMDSPGALEQMLRTFREPGANVLEVAHHRFSGDAPIGQIVVSITAETRNEAHIEELKALLEKRGYALTAQTR
ncbi:MAG: pyridoxal-phosphate dependent enzyme [Gammaproteobacteria bacterium]|nr:pyridoxal-phosphate dependent enzyme [Gammaproteobacteria bacterium]